MKKLKKILVLALTGILMTSSLFTFGGCSKYENKEVEALIHTAKAYLQRGVAIQYDMQDLPGTNEERRNLAKKQPEEYTQQNADFLDCSSFAWGVYMSALDYDTGYTSTKALMESRSEVKAFSHKLTGEETDKDKKDLEKKYLKTLQKGDLVVYRSSGGGHVMLYVGDDEGLPKGHDIIHSTGDSWENYEDIGTIQTMSVSELFDENNDRRYVFNGKKVWFGIIRPFNMYDKYDQPLPENSVNRINNLYGITAEKLCSVPYGGTVGLGEEITYSFSIKNANDKAKTLSVTDTVPTNTTFVSATNNGANDNGNLSWNVEVPANGTAEVSYTVKVNNDVTLIGKSIYSDTALICGVKFTCQKVYIGNTLNATQMQTIKTNVTTVKTTALRGVDAVNNIYAGLNAVAFEGTVTDVFNAVVSQDALNSNGRYYKMIAPSLYAGNIVTSTGLYDGERPRIILPHYLMTGDVVVLRDFDTLVSGQPTDKMYIFDGDNLVDLTSTQIENVDTFDVLQLPYSKNRNVLLTVLRPSLAN